MECISGKERFWVIIPDYPNTTSDDRYRAFFHDSAQSAMKKEKKINLWDYRSILIRIEKVINRLNFNVRRKDKNA